MPHNRAMARLLLCAVFLGALLESFASEAPLILNARRMHLGIANSPEWESFRGHAPDARRLDLRFRAEANLHEATLFIRQDDVRQDWFVELNGSRLGKLFLMEADL